MAILIVSHDLEYVYKYADSVMLLDNTVLAYGSPRDVYNTKAFEETFGGFRPEDDAVVIDKNHPVKTAEEPYDPSYKGGKA